MLRIKCVDRCVPANVVFQDPIFEKFTRTGDLTKVIDKSAEACIGGPHKGTTVFYRPEYGHGEMLVRCTAPSEPGIIGEIDQGICPIFYMLPGNLGENDLETDQYPGR